MKQDKRSLGVALIGVGMVSGTYVDAISKLDGISLVGVMGRTPESGAAFLAKHGQALGAEMRGFASVDDLASDPRVDFVCLTTPPNARFALVEALAKAGKPILMEKPVERTLDAATKLCSICEEADVPLGIMLQHRARPSALALYNRIDNNFGPLRAVEITVPWWRQQSYYDEPGRGSYERDGGGVMISQAIHTLDLALQFTGPVRYVTAMCATSDFHRMEAEDFVSAGLSFGSSVPGSFFASTASFPGRTEEIILHYKNVSASLRAGLFELHWQSGQSEVIGDSGGSGAGADPMAFTSDWHGAMIANFADHLRIGQPLIAPARSALAVHALIEAIEISARDGCRVELAT